MNKNILIVLFGGVLMAALDIAIIGPAMPAIQQPFNISDRDLPWMINIYILSNLAFSPLLAKLSDLYGRRNVYLFAISLFLLGSIVVSLAQNYEFILIGRSIQGIGAGGIIPVASAVIGDTFPREKQGRALGLIGAVFGIAFVLGPIVGGLLLMLNWRLIFLINIPMSIAVIYGAIKLLPQRKNDSPRKIDYVGLLLLIISLTGFSWAINHLEPKNLLNSFLSIHVLPTLIVSLVLIPIFFYSQIKSKYPIMKPELFTKKQLLITYVISFTAGLGTIAVMYLPALTRLNFGYTMAKSSLMLTPLALTLVIGAPTAGRLIDKFGSKIVINIGIALIAIGLFTIYLKSGNLITFYIADVFLGFGLAFMVGAPLRYIVNQETTTEDRASGQSLLSIFDSTGKLTIAALMGSLIYGMGGGVKGYELAFLVLFILSLLVFTISFGLKSRKNEMQSTENKEG